VSLTPFDEAKAVYAREPSVRTFEADLALHFEFGYVFATPRFFIMGRPVKKDAPHGLILDPSYVFERGECDCWLVWLAAGDLGAAWSALPYELPWLAFERKNSLRFQPAHRIRRLCAS
jgi:hypothetical protein